MDEKTVRAPRDCAEGEVLRRLLGEEGRREALSRRTPCGGARGDRCVSGMQGDRCPLATPYDRPVQPRAEAGCDCGEGIGSPKGCEPNGIDGRSLAMVYASVHVWQELYEPHVGWKRGTIFRELDLPFGRGCGTEEGGKRHGC